VACHRDCLCKKNGKLVDHLLLHCEMTNALWNTIFSLVGLPQVMPLRVVDFFDCWKGFFGRSRNNNISGLRIFFKTITGQPPWT
jgi:hypothetical protein